MSNSFCKKGVSEEVWLETICSRIDSLDGITCQSFFVCSREFRLLIPVILAHKCLKGTLVGS